MKRKPTLFSLSLQRVAGLPFDVLNGLNADRTSSLITLLEKKQSKRTALALALSESLYKTIGNATKDNRKTLIQLRRDIFNKRPIRSEILTNSIFSDIHLRDTIQTYIHLEKEIVTIKNAIQKSYKEESKRAENALWQLSKNRQFLKGVALSSEMLYRKRNDRSAKTRRGMIKYLTRMAAKTSPFSTFTHTNIIDVKQKSTSQQRTISSHISLNTRILQYVQHLIYSHPRIYPHLSLQLNPTIEQHNKKIHFITLNNNKESLQRVKLNESLELLYSIARTHHGTLTLTIAADLFTKRWKKSISQKNALEYCYRLTKYGFFQFSHTVPATNPHWTENLIDYLQSLPQKTPAIDYLTHTLTKIIKDKKQYELESSVAKRAGILKRIFTAFRSACLKLHREARLDPAERASFKQTIHEIKNAQKNIPDKKKSVFEHRYTTTFPFTPKNLIYEDTTITGYKPPTSAQINPMTHAYNKLIDALTFLNTHDTEKRRMRNYFVRRFPKNEAVNFLSFYKAYYQYKNANNRKKSQTPQKDTWKVAVRRSFRPGQAVHNNAPIELQTDKLHALFSAHLKKPIEPIESSGIFCQFSGSAKSPQTIVESISHGYSRMISRFLTVAPKSFTDRVYAKNALSMNGDMFAEIADASYFNANVHPPLMPYILIPPNTTAHNTPRQKIIHLRDLEIVKIARYPYLILRHKKTKKTVYSFDLGFLGFQGRSYLYHFLHLFSKTPCIGTKQLLDTLVDGALTFQKKSSIQKIPRIIVDNNLILQRAQWRIPRTLLPIKTPGMKKCEYFIKISEWRRNIGLPDTVFVMIPKNLAKTKKEQILAKKVNKDDHKPQYINFMSPHLVELFASIITRVPVRLYIEEMLPKPEKGEHVTEYIYQWYHTS